MSLLDQAAYDAGAVFVNEQDFAEATEIAGTAVAALWGVAELADLGQGFLADTARVWVAVSDLAAAPARGTAVTRYPDLPAEEAWEVDAVTKGPAFWQLTVRKAVRPVPRPREWRR